MSTLTESQYEAAMENLTPTHDNGKRFDEEREASEDFRSTVEQAVESESAARTFKEDFEKTRELRAEIETRFPGLKTSQVLEEFATFNEEMRRNPADKATEFAKFYSRWGRLGDPPKVPTLENPYHEATPGHDIYKAMHDLKRDQGEADRIWALRAKFGPDPLPHVLKNILDLDAMAAKNPFKAASRWAASAGLPIDAEDIAQQRQSALEAQQLAAAQEQIAASAAAVLKEEMKGLSPEEVSALEREYYKVLGSAKVPTTGDAAREVLEIVRIAKARLFGAKSKSPAKPKAPRQHDSGIDEELRSELRKNLRAARSVA